jgi:signal transduction histidine kinase
VSWTFSPRERLLGITAITLLFPVLIVLAAQLANVLSGQHQSVEREARSRAERIVQEADAQVQAELAGLRVLGASVELRRKDWPSMRREALSALAINKNWRALAIVEVASGEAVVHVDNSDVRPALFREPLPVRTAEIGGVSREGLNCPCVDLRTRAAANADFVLVLKATPDIYQQALLRHTRVGDVTALVDRTGAFIARSLAYQDRVGTPASAYVRNAIAAGDNGFYRGRTLEGFENYSAYYTSALSQWSAHVAVRSILIDATQLARFWVTIAAALLGVLLAAAIAAYLVLETNARRREAEQMLRLQKAEALSSFTAAIVHDFRNVVAVTQASLKLIARRSSEEGIEELARAGEHALMRGARLANQILSFARTDKAEIVPLDLRTLLVGIEDLLRASAGPGVEISIEREAGWPLVLGNIDQLELAFVNLATNARDAMGGAGKIAITAARDGHFLAVCVADTGPGIPAHIRRHLFEPFFTTKPRGIGTGLGLAQVAGAVRQSGGSIHVKDAPGGGAMFVLCLPIAEALPEPVALSA